VRAVGPPSASRFLHKIAICVPLLLTETRLIERRAVSAGIATGQDVDADSWSSSPENVDNVNFSISSSPAARSTQHPMKWVPMALCFGLYWPERVADNSPSTRAEVPKTWIYTSTPSHAFTVPLGKYYGNLSTVPQLLPSTTMPIHSPNHKNFYSPY
jgi:hypothetical protein